jgi:hypothetical protein
MNPEAAERTTRGKEKHDGNNDTKEVKLTCKYTICPHPKEI